MKKHLSKRSKDLNKRLMESWGYTRPLTPEDSYKVGYNGYYRDDNRKTDAGDVVKTDAAAVVAGMVKVLEDGEPGTQADAEVLLNKLLKPSTASGGSKDLYNRFQSAKEEAVEEYFGATRGLSPNSEKSSTAAPETLEGLISENAPSFDTWARDNAPPARGDDHQAGESAYQTWRDKDQRKAEYEAYLDKLENDKIDKAAEEFYGQNRNPDEDPLYNYRFEEGNTEKHPSDAVAKHLEKKYLKYLSRGRTPEQEEYWKNLAITGKGRADQLKDLKGFADDVKNAGYEDWSTFHKERENHASIGEFLDSLESEHTDDDEIYSNQ